MSLSPFGGKLHEDREHHCFAQQHFLCSPVVAAPSVDIQYECMDEQCVGLSTFTDCVSAGKLHPRSPGDFTRSPEAGTIVSILQMEKQRLRSLT